MRYLVSTLTYPLRDFIKRLIENYRLRIRFKNLKISGNSSIVNTKFGQFNYVENASINNATFGDFSYVGSDSYVNFADIGKFTCIGPGVQIGLGEHPVTDFVSVHPIFYSKARQVGISFADKNYFEEYNKTEIGNDVWIGAGVIVLGGINIGDGAIIAAGAVVTKNIEPYTIVGGVPAKFIKRRFSEEKITELLKLKWWDKDFEWLRKNYKKFHSVKDFTTH